MPIQQVHLNERNQAAIVDMLKVVAPEFSKHSYTVNEDTLNHSVRGIVHIAQVIYYSIPQKMVYKGVPADEVYLHRDEDVNGFCGHLYRLFLRYLK